MSKSSLDSHRGGTSDTGLPTTRRRNAGTRIDISSMRWVRTLRFGFFSSMTTMVITDRSNGSVSTPHITASNTPMRLSTLRDTMHLHSDAEPSQRRAVGPVEWRRS